MSSARMESEESLARIAGRRIVRRVRGEAGTPGFARLLLFQASGGGGDALVALALAGSLFFSVPEATARGKVALYLALTLAPFAIVAPLLSSVLDHHRGSLRAAMLIAAVGRGSLSWLLATRLDSLLLFPLGFGLLVLSRAVLVIRGAALPDLVPEGRSLVEANASLSKSAAIAGIAATIPGLALLHWVGANSELLLATVVYYAGALPALRLPAGRGRRPANERTDAREAARSLVVRQGIIAAAGMRFLVGFLVFHLAFALRREDFGSLGLGLLVAGAASGSLLGALIAPRISRRLREEGILAGALALAGAAGLLSGRWFSLASAVMLVVCFSVTAGAAKVAFDALVQRDTPEGARGWAFARFESALQLAWVMGAAVPLLLPLPSGAGVVAAGVIAIVIAFVFIAGRARAARRSSRSARALT